ncbi:MAG: hypothetical protein FJ148_17250 [Deltaproteobacteria bacterium]|nr:hypothetical protein [Deltaproteobacteria bacterium]
MRRIALGTVVLSFALVSMAWAGAKDTSQNTVVDINSTGTIDNTLAKSKIQSSKPCSLQAQIQTLAGPGTADGDVVICIADADLFTPAAGGNGLVIATELKKGKVNLKADLAEVDILGSGCGDTEAISYNGAIRCFLDDATYRGDANVAGSWRADCAAIGGLQSGAPGPTKLKVNSTQSVVVGICQTFTVGARLFGPGAGIDFARTGQRTPHVP